MAVAVQGPGVLFWAQVQRPEQALLQCNERWLMRGLDLGLVQGLLQWLVRLLLQILLQRLLRVLGQGLVWGLGLPLSSGERPTKRVMSDK